MKVRILENYKKNDNGNITCTERSYNINSFDFDFDGDIYIDGTEGEHDVIEVNKTHYVSDIIIVMDK